MQKRRVEAKDSDAEKIAKRLAIMDDDERRRHEKAIAEGYKDEVCSGCGVVFLALHHFVICDADPCPMKLRDEKGNAPTLLDMMVDGVPKPDPDPSP